MTNETVFIQDTIDGEMVELDSINDAVKWVEENYTEGDTVHIDFYSFNIFKKVGSVDAIIEDGICAKIILNETP